MLIQVVLRFKNFGEKKIVTTSNFEGESSTLSSFSPELIPLVLAHVWLWPKVVKASGSSGNGKNCGIGIGSGSGSGSESGSSISSRGKSGGGDR